MISYLFIVKGDPDQKDIELIQCLVDLKDTHDVVESDQKRWKM